MDSKRTELTHRGVCSKKQLKRQSCCADLYAHAVNGGDDNGGLGSDEFAPGHDIDDAIAEFGFAARS